jgi:NTP pyrophosphatase (non-canonical NTP hydrolase)
MKPDELANYALGMVCEAGEVGDIIQKYLFCGYELDTNGLKKEMGDTLWYISNICTLTNIKLSSLIQSPVIKSSIILGTNESSYISNLTKYTMGMVCRVGAAGDMIKKHFFHGHELDMNKLESELYNALRNMNYICMILGITMDEVAELNIKKLLDRYPNGFSSTDSVNRKG